MTEFWRVEWRDTTRQPTVDFYYSSTKDGAYMYAHDMALKLGEKEGRKLDSAWWFAIWEEKMDIENDGDCIDQIDWWGNRIDPINKKIGWHYNEELQPVHDEPDYDGCPACAEHLERDIKTAKEEASLPFMPTVVAYRPSPEAKAKGVKGWNEDQIPPRKDNGVK